MRDRFDSTSSPPENDCSSPIAEYYRQFIEAGGYVFFVMDADGNLTHVSGAVAKLTGYAPEALIGQPASKLVKPEWRDRVTDSYTKQQDRREEGTVLEYPIVTREGVDRWIEQRTITVTGTGEADAGEVFRVACLQDITDRRRVEDALRASEARFKAFFETATEAIVIVDGSSCITMFNRSAEAMFGYAQNEIVGQPLDLLIPSHLRAAHTEHVKAYLATPRSRPMAVGLELSARRNDGTEFPVEISLSYNADTQETVAFVVDITERVQFQQELAKRVEQLTTLRVVDGALAERLDVDYVLKIALESTAQLSGAEAGFISLFEEPGTMRVADVWGDYAQLLGDEYPAEGQGVVARVIRGHEPEWIVDVSADPDYVPTRAQTVSQIVVPLLTHDDLVGILNLETAQPDGFNEDTFTLVKLIASRIATSIDNARLHWATTTQLAELRELYAKVSQLEQLKTDMIRIAAHDLRNPLSAILGNAELVRSGLAHGEDIEELRGLLKNIDESVYRMRNITSDILSLERIEQAAQELVYHPFDLRGLVEATYNDTLADVRVESREITLAVPETPVTVLGDPTQLREAIANLLSNAVKYTRSDGHIVARLWCEGNDAVFAVNDDGYGIRPEQQDKLFQPFYRARTAKTADIEGTGLGLHLVKNIVERHSGTVRFESEYEKGSMFGFMVPLTPE